MRVLITGMGGELGTAVASAIETDTRVERVVGLDLYPPRRFLQRAEFHRVDPRNRERTARLVHDIQPTAIVHLGVYEPYSRSSPRSAVARTAAGTVAVVDAAIDAGALDRIVVRSGIEVYGRRRGAPTRPDEGAPTDPSSAFGHSLLHVELVCSQAGLRAAVPVTALRLGTVMGPHVPSPLGRLLRLPLVPFAPLSDAPFSVLHQDDVTAFVVAALDRPHHGPLNVVGPGAVTVSQAARMGGKVPLPVVGPGWRGALALAELLGAPVPDHVYELLLRGRTADGSRSVEVLGLAAPHPTREVIRQVHAWEPVTYLRSTAA